MSNKYRAVFLHVMGFSDEAFSQLTGTKHDELFRDLHRNMEGVDGAVYAILAKHYANLGLNRMFHSLSEMIQVLHIMEKGDIADIEELVSWAEETLGDAGILLRYIYEKRIACYKKGELLLDSEYEMMREGIRAHNREIESIVLTK